MTATPACPLRRNALGQLEYTDGLGEIHQGVVPVRAFPITFPERGIALVDPRGHELLWIEHLTDLPEEMRALIAEELAGREFTPVIRRIVGVSSFATPSTWEIETDQSKTNLILKGEEDIRRLAPPALLIADTHGIHYLIPDRQALDQSSRKILDRFL